MFERLEAIEKRYIELEHKLVDPAGRVDKYMKRYKKQ